MNDQVWRSYKFNIGDVKYWQIGSLKLWVQSKPYEWRVVSELAEDPLLTEVEIQDEAVMPEVIEPESLRRYATTTTDTSVVITPSLANLAVVARPEIAILVPPNQAATLYVSTPLWVQISLEKTGVLLNELPAVRLSDTWFGPSPVEGEFSLAVRTMARLHFEDVPLRPHRAATSVTIKNLSESLLELERIKIPMTHLTLYRSKDGHFFTEQLFYQKERSGEEVKITLGTKPPAEAGPCQKFAKPREKLESNFVVKTFKSIFSQRTE